MGQEEFSFKTSYNEVVYGNKWLIKEPKANVVIVHGMAEHSLRYDEFALYLNSLGFDVYAVDQPGHGKNISKADKPVRAYGEWPKDGFDLAVKQVDEEVDYLHSISDKKILVFGHSMGSFITQRYYQLHSEKIEAAVICGSSFNNATYRFSNVLAHVMNVFILPSCKNHPSKFFPNVQNMAFNAGSPKHFSDGYTSNNRWISYNEENVRKYDLDSECGYACSFNFYYSLFAGLQKTFNKANLSKIKVNRDLLIISGEKDPVGGNGKYIKELAKFYKNDKAEVKMILYPNMKHEILNEKGHEKVEKDVGEFLLNVLNKQAK